MNTALLTCYLTGWILTPVIVAFKQARDSDIEELGAVIIIWCLIGTVWPVFVVAKAVKVVAERIAP